MRVSRGSCSIIVQHQLRFDAVDSSITRNIAQSEIADMRSEISELRDENYTLKKRIKELESQLDHKTSKVWYCQICMEEDQATGVDGFGSNDGS